FLALVAFAFPYLKSRFRLLQVMINNEPSKLQTMSASPYEIKFGDIVHNCEDAHLDEENGFVLLSCDPGRDKWNTVMGTFIDPSPAGKLYLYHYTDPSAIPVPITFLDFPGGAQDFHPLGIEYHSPTSTLFVINHASTGSVIEIFTLSPNQNPPTAHHTRTLSHPLIWTPNSLIALSSHDLLVTNDHYFRRSDHPWLALLETYAVIPGGSVVHIDLRAPEQNMEITTLAHAPFANGIARLNDTSIAVAALTALETRFYDLELHDNSPPTLTFRSSVQLPFFPDNLHVDGSGALLIAGHAHPPSLDKAIMRRLECLEEGESALGREDCRMDAPSWVSEWREGVGRRDLFVGTEYGSACTVVRDSRRGTWIVTGLYARGIFAGEGA
ncbi:hypothetical protein K490DRAFT_37314, partial [Saccharata proteae CBS 121410]